MIVVVIMAQTQKYVCGLLLTMLLTFGHALDIGVREGDLIPLFCKADTPWIFCKWTHKSSGTSCRTFIDNGEPSCKIKVAPNDVNNGSRILWQSSPTDCSILINPVVLEDNSEWECTLTDDANDMTTQEVNVTVFWPTQVVFHTRPHRQMVVGERYYIQCSAHGGYPSPTLLAFVGKKHDVIDHGRDENLEQLGEATQNIDPNTQVISTSKAFEYTPSRLDHNSYVKCVAYQSDRGEDIYQPHLVSNRFAVAFPPLPFNDDNLSEKHVEMFYVTEGQPANITMVFFAMPTPADNEVIWHFTRSNSADSIQLASGSSLGRFEALHLVDFGDNMVGPEEFGKVTATLILNHVTKEDTVSNSYLEVNNKYGSNYFKFQLTFAIPIEHTTKSPDDDEDNKPINVGLIIGIVIAAVLVVVIVTVLVLWAKKANKCCFSNDNQLRSKDAQQEPDNSDNEAYPDNTTQNPNVHLLSGAQDGPSGAYSPSNNEIDSDIPHADSNGLNEEGRQPLSNEDEPKKLKNFNLPGSLPLPKNRESYRYATSQKSPITSDL